MMKRMLNAFSDQQRCKLMTAPLSLKLTFRLVEVPGGDVEVPYVEIQGLTDDRARGDGSVGSVRVLVFAMAFE